MSAGAPRRLSRRALAGVALLTIGALLGALGGGLARLGTLPATAVGPTGDAPLAQHGALMMAGFFGAVISLERAVALQRGLWVPALAAVGALLGWMAGWWALAALCWLASALGLCSLYAWAARHRAVSLPLGVEAAGALALFVGTLAWWLGQWGAARLGWSAFLLLTIAGERRELMRMVPLPRWARAVFHPLWLGLLGVPVLAALGWADALTGWWALCAALAAWLLRFDVALRLLRAPGWAGHTAICLVTGYLWLMLAALLGLAGRAEAWHLLWLGFVMAMVFGHAPIMLPALAGWRPRPTRLALLPLALLGASLVLRTAGTAPAWAGAGHALALLGFAGVMGWSVRRA